MAGVLFQYARTVTPSVNPQTLLQLRVPANRRTLLHAIDFMPLGSTPAEVPLLFALTLQDTSGTLDTNASSSLVKEVPAFAGSLLTEVHHTASVEPSSNTDYDIITVHNQARLRWTPPTLRGYRILDQSTRWAIRNVGAVVSVPMRLVLSLEE